MVERKIGRAVITGPTGAIGTALCLTLAENGIEVFAVCRPGSPRIGQIPKHEGIRTVECDVAELSRLPMMIPDGADAFFHLAWAHTIGSGRDDMKAQTSNIDHTVDAVNAASALGCQVFIGAGSQAEYGRAEGALRPDTPCFPENGYGMAKLCAGAMSRVECRKLGLDHVWVRILSVYGPADSESTMISGVIKKLLNKEIPSLTEGIQKWDYLFSEDAARAFLLIARHGISEKTYVLGGGKAKPLKEYIEELKNAIDPSLGLGFGEVPYGPRQVMHLEADISELQRDTGFEARTSFADGIRKTIKKYAESK